MSVTYGQNQLRYFLDNTVNPSFGPETPTSFYVSQLKQSETNFHADFSYPIEVGLASPLNIAWGAEYRREAYEVGLTFAVTHPAAIYYGAVPVKPEKSVNLTAGIVITPGSGTNLTIDYYNIRIRDRLGLSQAFVVSAADRVALAARGVSNADELNRVQYSTNAFKTRTQGVDAVLTNVLHTDSAGTFNTSLGVNYNKTDVIDRNPAIVSDDRVANLEHVLPKLRVNFTETWSSGPFSLLARVNYYSKFTVTSSANVAQTFGSEIVADLEASYEFNDNFTLSAGVQNLFDNYPDKDLRSIDPNTGLPGNGNQYIDASPFGYNGGFWYVRAGLNF